MRRRLALVAALCLGPSALCEFPGVRSVVHAQEQVKAKTYRVAFTFEGLVTFVPVGKAADGKTAKELWVLSPAAERIKTITDQAGSRRNDNRFRPKDGKYVAHHTLLCAPAAAVANPGGGEGQLLTVLDGGLRDLELSGLPDTDKCDGLPDPHKCVDLEELDDLPEVRDGGATAHACPGCIGSGAPAVLPHGTTVPLGLRMVFNHKATVSVTHHMDAKWRYSKGDSNGRRRLPSAVTVTTPELTGPTSLTIKSAGQEMRLAIAPPADGKTVEFRIMSAPAAEVLDRQGAAMDPSMPREAPLEHFKLGYLLAPKATTAGRPYDYDYDDYLHPIVLPPTMPPSAPPPFCRALGVTVTAANGDPFCTSPSRMAP
jgi:hypothetical protein